MKFKKPIIPISIGLIAILMLIVEFLILKPTYMISGRITDIDDNKPMAGVIVSINNTNVKTDNNGLYQIKNVGKQSEIIINQPTSYEPAPKTSVNFNNLIGSNTIIKDFKLTPTPVEMENRNEKAFNNNQFDVIWNNMHPDDQKNWGSESDYISLQQKAYEIENKNGYGVKSYKVDNKTKLLPSWQSKITDKTYKNVTEVSVEAMFMNGETEKYSYNWIKVDGRWKYFAGIKKIELQNYVDYYDN